MTTTKTKKTFPTDALVRWTGLAAVAAGAIFAGIQPIHPPDLIASVTTTPWAVVIALKFAMCLLFLVGITGLYIRQAGKAGWLGFAGFVLLILSWWLQTGYVFVDAFVLPVLPDVAPDFISSFLGMVNPASPVTMDVGLMGPAYAIMGILYMLGGLIFGIATVRAGVLPRLPAIVLAVAAVATPFAVLLPHEIQRYAAIPFGFAIAWLGYTLWSARTIGARFEAAATAAHATAQ
jgi:hypothetical protein